jgi:hypothetical protein
VLRENSGQVKVALGAEVEARAKPLNIIGYSDIAKRIHEILKTKEQWSKS